MMAEPPAKRPKMALSTGEASSLPGSRMLHQTVLVMLFLVRLGGRSTDAVTASFSHIGSMVQTYVDRAFQKYHEMISSKLESFQGQIEGLHREVRQLARVCSIRYADEQTRKGPNHEDAAAEGSNTNTRLCFLNALNPPFYTNKNITAGDNAANKKSYPPKLYDEVYRLEKISKDGDYHKRLKDAQIYTVEDFLKALNKDPDNLRKVLQMRRQRDTWSKLTKHAREYILEDRKELKPYVSKDGNVIVLFNCVYDIVGAMFYGDYVASENFDSHQKVLTNKLKEQAYNILENIPSR